MKYLLCVPQGGFCDNLMVIQKCVEYCKNYNRILLLNMKDGLTYKINFSDYFYFNETSPVKIITNISKINKILADSKLTFFPENIKNNIGKLKFQSYKNGYSLKNMDQVLNLNFEYKYSQDVITYVNCAKYKTNMLTLFKTIEFNDEILIDFLIKYNKIPKPYICMQIRNSDRNCDYKKLYKDNTKLIDNYKTLVIATDDKDSLIYFNSSLIDYLNFTTFPDKNHANQGLHYSSLSGDRKIKDTISDLLIIALSDKIISNSTGSYIKLARELNEVKEIIKAKTIDKNIDVNKIIHEKKKQIKIQKKKNNLRLLKFIKSK